VFKVLFFEKDRNRIRAAFGEADQRDARRDGNPALHIHYPGTYPDSFDDDIDEQSEEISLVDIVTAWAGNAEEAIREFTVSGQFLPLVFPKAGPGCDLGVLLKDTRSLAGKEHWYRLLCLGCSMGVRLGVRPAVRILPFWNKQLGEKFWADTIPKSLAEAETGRFQTHLEAFFDEIIHRTFRDENASGEDAEFWRRVFYDFRKMHSLVFRDDLPSTLLEIANSESADGNALITFLRNGRVPLSLQMPGREQWSGILGQSISAPLLFVMRELRRLEVLPGNGFDQACYYMNSPARRVAYRLRWITDEQRTNYSFGNLVDLSKEIWERLNGDGACEELLPYFDLPFQWYALNNG
jgi:hypothetical protein